MIKRTRELSLVNLCTALGKNLQYLMEKSHINLTQLAKRTRVPIATIQRISHDPHANPTLGTLKPIADFFQLTIDELISRDLLNAPRSMQDNSWTHIPIITWEQAMTWSIQPSMHHASLFIAADLPRADHFFALIIQADNWQGFLKNSILIVDPSLQPKHHDYVIVQQPPQSQAALKHFVVWENNNMLKPVTYKSDAMLVSAEANNILGTVVQIRLDRC